jgi:hypothetical protein
VLHLSWHKRQRSHRNLVTNNMIVLLIFRNIKKEKKKHNLNEFSSKRVP